MKKKNVLGIGIIQLLVCCLLVACSSTKKNIMEEMEMETVRIYAIPDCKMVSSGIGNFGEGKFGVFEKWLSTEAPRDIFSHDFLTWENGGFHWMFYYTEGMVVPKELDIIDFKGGLYAVVTGIDGQSNEVPNKTRDEFLKTHGLEIDNSRPHLGHIVRSSSVLKALGYEPGYEQIDYWAPIKPIGK